MRLGNLWYIFLSYVSGNGWNVTFPSVVIARRSHLFPYRTQQLSFFALTILGGRLPGNLSHCRNFPSYSCGRAFFYFYRYSTVILQLFYYQIFFSMMGIQLPFFHLSSWDACSLYQFYGIPILDTALYDFCPLKLLSECFFPFFSPSFILLNVQVTKSNYAAW